MIRSIRFHQFSQELFVGYPGIYEDGFHIPGCEGVDCCLPIIYAGSLR
jgi:hypothetical protein